MYFLGIEILLDIIEHSYELSVRGSFLQWQMAIRLKNSRLISILSSNG